MVAFLNEKFVSHIQLKKGRHDTQHNNT